MLRKLISLTLSALVLLLMCSDAVASDANIKASISFWFTPLTNTMEQDVEEILLPKFHESYPNVDVEYQLIPWEGVTEKMEIAMSTGTTPDVFLDGTARTAKLPTSGLVEDVSDVIADFDDWYDAVLAIGQIDGKHYLVPATTIACSALAVNVTLAKELGVYDLLPEDRESWTFEQLYNFIEAASVAGKDKGIYGTTLYAGSQTSDDIMYTLMLSNGGKILSDDRSECLANSPECVRIVEMLKKINDNGYCVPGAASMESDSTFFLSEKAVLAFNTAAANTMIQMEESFRDGLIGRVPEILNYAVPTVDGKPGMNSASWGANCFAVFTNGNDAQTIAAAKVFVKTFMDTPEMALAIWNYAPTYTPVRDIGLVYTNENALIASEVALRAEWSGKYSNSTFGILESYWPQVRTCFYPELQAVYAGTKTPQEAMDSFKANVDKILAGR